MTFYNFFLFHIKTIKKTLYLKGLKLLLESWARLEDEASENLKEELQNIRLEWGKLARLFFRS